MGKFIYAIVSVKSNPDKLTELLQGIRGVSGVCLSVISLDEVAVVVSDIEKSDIIADTSNAMEYAGVIDKLFHRFTLLPMRFGSVLESNDAVEKMVRRNFPDICHNLQKLENRHEFGLKIFCDPEKIIAGKIAGIEKNTGIEPDPATEVKTSVYRDYVNQKLKAHRQEELLLTYVESVIAELETALSRMNAVTKFKKMVTATTIIDAVFLLEKAQKDTLVHAVEVLQNRHTGLTLVLTGPWPPYSFVEITIK